MEKKICIGDIRTTCEDYYNRTKQMLSFSKALGLTLEKEPISQNMVWSSGFMSLEEFGYLIDSIPLFDFLQKFHTRGKRYSQKWNAGGSLYLCERAFFNEFEDVKAFIHIPFVDNGQHIHDHFEIIYVYSGEVTLIFGEERKVLKAGSICIFVPDFPHNVIVLQGALIITIIARKTSFEMIFSSLLKQGGILSVFLHKALYENVAPNYLLYQTDNSTQIQAFLQEIMREAKRNDSHSSMNIASLITLLFSLILRQYEHTAIFFDLTDQFCGSYNFLVLLQYIKQNYRTVTLSELSNVFHYKETYLSKKISQTIGMSFSQLLQNLRLENSKILLKTTKYSLHKISDCIGYESTEHFARIFKKKYGITPTQYRQEHDSNI